MYSCIEKQNTEQELGSQQQKMHQKNMRVSYGQKETSTLDLESNRIERSPSTVTLRTEPPQTGKQGQRDQLYSKSGITHRKARGA